MNLMYNFKIFRHAACGHLVAPETDGLRVRSGKSFSLKTSALESAQVVPVPGTPSPFICLAITSFPLKSQLGFLTVPRQAWAQRRLCTTVPLSTRGSVLPGLCGGLTDRGSQEALTLANSPGIPRSWHGCWLGKAQHVLASPCNPFAPLVYLLKTD